MVTGLSVLTIAAVAMSGAGLVTAEPAAAATRRLSFDPPSLATLRSSPRRVFAHYLPSLPISFDNRSSRYDYWARQYLRPLGENGIHAAYGGFTRDRPRGRAVRPESSWRLLDMEWEVRHAIAARIDGFSVDLLSVRRGSNNLRNTRLLLRAARAVDPRFKIMLMPDMTTLGSKSPAQLAAAIAALAAYRSAFRLGDGRLVVSPFKAERHSAIWWRHFISLMRTAHGIRVALVPTFLDERPYVSSFARISYGMSNWGGRNPAYNNVTTVTASSPLGRARAVTRRGLLWMQPVGYQDERPRSGIFDEAQNTRNLRATWLLAVRTHARWVQLTTWNDYVEGSHFAPSVKHGLVPLDISAYYLTRYKTGAWPRIVRPAVYLTHRTQFWTATPAFGQTLLMRLRGGSPARNTVEALTFSPAGATVRVTVGGVTRQCAIPRGVSWCTVPLRVGHVRAVLTRPGSFTSTVASPFVVSATPYVQDLQYVSVGSIRQGHTYR